MTIQASLLTNYLEEVQQLKIQADQSNNCTDLLNYIHNRIAEEKDKEKDQDNEENLIFLEGELAFYESNYELALKNYLKCKSIEGYHFFCYRASAFVALKAGQPAKSIEFARKALQKQPNDYVTLQLLNVELAGFLPPEEQEVLHSNFISSLKSYQNEEINENNQNLKNGAEPKAEEAEDSSEDIINFSQPMESNMHTKENTQEGTLTHRLYDSHTATIPDTFSSLKKEDASTIYDALKRNGHESTYDSYSLHQTGNHGNSNNDPESALENRIRSFQLGQTQLISQYIAETRQRSRLNDHFLYILNGWNLPQGLNHSAKGHTIPSESWQAPFLLTDQMRRTAGGIYLRWHGKGVVINPGRHFLDQFHAQGLNVRDIDFVIITRDAEETYSDVKEIYNLNYQLNTANQGIHLIHYYFNPRAFAQVGKQLKPHFKQERNTVHCLELYVDSPDVERVELTEWLTLQYFPTSGYDSGRYQNLNGKDEASKFPSSLGIRLDCKTTTETGRFSFKKPDILSIGYFSGTPWSPILAHHLGECDFLISGFDRTEANDYNKLKYNEDCLGYHGTFSLLEEINPRLLVCCEFGGHEGDIRLEVVKKMRQDYATSAQGRMEKSLPAILPGDTGLYIDLATLQVRCSVSKELIDPALIRVVKSADAFGQLQYLSPSCCL